MKKQICKCCRRLAEAIEKYLAKEEENLSEELEKMGYAGAADSVKSAGDLEDELAEKLLRQTDQILDFLKGCATLEVASEMLASFFDGDLTREAMQKAIESYYIKEVPNLANVYIKETDGELVVSQIRRRTSAWISEWSSQLSDMMQLTSEQEIGSLIHASIQNGESVDDLARRIMNAGVRKEQWRARRVALTEMLRAHSVAQQESMTQDPSVCKKKWVHTGSYRMKPRKNHVEMSGKIVFKNEPYELKGIKGDTYHPMYPRDSRLPPEESVNCHCLSQPIVDDDMLGISLEEREEMQRKIIEEDDGNWLEELEARNKAAAGINEETVRLDWIRQKDRDAQIKYFGGGDAGKQRLALVESGVISTDEELERLYKVDGNGKRVRKTLQELADDGIFTVGRKALEHSALGDFTSPGKQYPAGRMKAGGHSQTAMEMCDEKGIEYTVSKVFSNGVRIGNVPSSGMTAKRSGNGQAWFPESWTEEKIRIAGTAVANNGEALMDGYYKTGVYDGVAVRVLVADGSIGTVCPDLDQSDYVKGVE